MMTMDYEAYIHKHGYIYKVGIQVTARFSVLSKTGPPCGSSAGKFVALHHQHVQ